MTLATAFALPLDFPERDVLVLTAFAVVLATLVIQGATLAPIIRHLGLGREDEFRRELEMARKSLAEAAYRRMETEEGAEAEAIRAICKDHWTGRDEATEVSPGARRRQLTIEAIIAQRKRLEELRNADKIGPTHYLELQEDLDWKQLANESEDERRITEG